MQELNHSPMKKLEIIVQGKYNKVFGQNAFLDVYAGVAESSRPELAGIRDAARAALDLQPPVFDPVERWPGSITGPLAATAEETIKYL